MVKCLENERVRHVFGIPGEENLDLMDSLIDSDMEFVLTRHESSAAFMAGMIGRLTRRPGHASPPSDRGPRTWSSGWPRHI